MNKNNFAAIIGAAKLTVVVNLLSIILVVAVLI